MISSKNLLSRFAPVAGLVLLGILLAACSSKDKKVDPPAELTDFKSTINVKKLWSQSTGGDKPKLRLGLGVAVEDNRVFAAGHDGEVHAYALDSGKQLWRTKTKTKLAGGPGVGQGVVVVGASYGDIVALDAATGAQKWKTRVNSEILSAPAVGSDMVVLRSVDGRLHGLRLGDGSEIWSAEQQVPRLSLRGTAAPIIAGDVAVSGFDNGRVMAVNLRDGSTAWDTTVAPPSGRSELERLVDIDSSLRAVDDDLYAVSFQGKVVRLARDTGQVWWSRDLSSYRGLAIDEDGVYVSTADGLVVKIGRRTGIEIWRQEVLSNRRLSAPAVLDGQVAVADLKGYVHFLDVGSGALSARESSGGERVSNAPVVANDTLLVINDEGRISAFRIVPPKG
jgi:outer membrane protein assembly factor BamB